MTSAPDLDALAATTVRALPTLAPDHRRLGIAIYAVMAAGKAATVPALAAASALGEDAVARLLETLPTATTAGGEVSAFLGLQRAPGAHRLSFETAALSTWCAWDTLFLPALLDRPATVASVCPVTGAPITLAVDPRAGVTGAPPATRLTFLADPAPFDGEVIAGFCRWIHFVRDDAAAAAWLAAGPGARPRGVVLGLDEGFALGRLTNALLFGVR